MYCLVVIYQSTNTEVHEGNDEISKNLPESVAKVESGLLGCLQSIGRSEFLIPLKGGFYCNWFYLPANEYHLYVDDCERKGKNVQFFAKNMVHESQTPYRLRN